MKILKTILMLALIQGGIFSQHITNTLGVNGLFKIKDNSLTYLTLTQATGYVDLSKSLKLAVTTDLNTGVIYKGANRFIHDYKNASNTGGNVFVGTNSGNFTLGGAGNSTYGSFNTAIGTNTMNALTTGSYNVALGYSTLSNITTGTYNIAIGPFALNSNTTGAYSIAIGDESLSNNTTGGSNIAIGYISLVNNTIGFNSIAIGNNSLVSNTNGGENVCLGRNSLYDNITGDKNTAIGNLGLTNSTGDFNTVIGYSSGSNLINGQNCTLIGYNAQASTTGVFNEITLGNNQVSWLRCNTQNITSLSDARDKKNINNLSLGLDFVMQLKPRQFNWDKREWYDNNISDGSKIESDPTAGFIAQELDEVQNNNNASWLKLVMKSNPDKWEATYGNLLPVVVKAIQELKSENDKLKEENEKLSAEVSRLSSIEERLAKLEVKVTKEEISKEIKMSEK